MLEDQGAIIRSGQAIVPDYAAEEAKKQLLSLQKQQLELQTREAQRQIDEEDAFHNDVAGVMTNPTAQNYAGLIAKHPKFAAQTKAAWGMIDGAKQQADLTQMAEVYSAAANGRYDLAAASLQRRIDADKAADGQADPTDEAMLAALQSDDPVQQKAAMGMIGLHLSAITGPEKFEQTLGALTKGDESFTLSPGSKRYDASGKLVAEAPFAPRELTLSPGQKAYEYQPGGGDQPSSGAGTSPDPKTVWQNMVGAEGGTNPDGSFRTSPKGAVGPAQVMPETAPEAAELAGLPYDEQRYRSDPAYNLALGQAYYGKQLSDFGDPVLAAAAYNAGPGAVRDALQKGGPSGWVSHLPKETQDYVQTVSGGAAPSGGSGPRVIAEGAPKGPSYKLMTPDENTAAGLDPNVRYQRNTETGQVTAVGGQDKSQGQLKPVPPQARNLIVSRRDALRQVDSAMAALDANPDAIGYIKGNLPDSIVQRTDPKGVTTRATIGKVAGQIIHDVSGAAVTMSEAPRFKPYIPSLTDTPAAAKAKLGQLHALLDAELGDFSATYGPENGYKGVNLAPVSGAGGGAPVKVRSIQEAAKLAPGTLFTAPNGKTYRKK